MLAFESVAPEFVRDLRRAIVLRSIFVPPQLLREESHLRRLKHEDFEQAHVYDVGHLLDVDHATYLGVEVGYKLLNQAMEIQKNDGLFIPHQRTMFINRQRPLGQPWGVYAHYAEETTDSIFIYCFFLKSGQWVWFGRSKALRKEEHNASGLVRSANLVFDHSVGSSNEVVQTLISDPVIAAMLLLQKSDTIIREPADWWMGEPPPAKPKAFERPNPSVTIVRVNTPRLIISPPQDASITPAPFTPRHVRTHIRTYANGRRTVVRSHVSPRDSNPSGPVTRVVRMQGKLKGDRTDGDTPSS